MSTESRPVLMFYDVECRLCRLFRDIVLRLDFRGRIIALPLNAPGARSSHPSDAGKWTSSFHILDEHGTLVSGGDALALLLQILLPDMGIAKSTEGSVAIGKMVRASYGKIAVLKSLLECGAPIRGGS